MKLHAFITSASTLLAGMISVHAAALNIVNPGFESDLATAQGNGGWSDAVPTGWSDPQGADNTNFLETIGGFASEGQVHLGFDGNEFGMVYQDLGVAWAPNTTYTLTVGVGRRGGFGAGLGRFGLGSSLDVLPASGPSPDGPYSLHTPSVFFSDFDTATVAVTDGTFSDAVFSFTTGAIAPAGNVRVSVQEISATRIHVDNFRLDATAAVPEPSSVALLGVLSGLALRRRRA
jgi:hypothetical protein